MAAISKTSSGKFRAQVRRKGISKAKTFSTQAEARRWAVTQEYNIDRQDWNDPGLLKDRTLEDVIRHYSHGKDINRATQSSINNLQYLHSVPLSRMTVEKVAEFAQWRIDEHQVKPATVILDIVVLGNLLSHARLRMKLPVSPTLITDIRKTLKQDGLISQSDERIRRPSQPELNLLMEYWQSKQFLRHSTIPMWTLVQFAIASCMRQSEITGLLWDDLDTEKMTITIRDRKHPTKKKGNDQTVPLIGNAFTIVESMPRDGDLVFPFNPRSISAGFTRACAKCGIEDLRFHDLRREGISRLIEAGYTVTEVATVSGHRDLNILWNRYTQITPESIHSSLSGRKVNKAE